MSRVRFPARIQTYPNVLKRTYLPVASWADRRKTYPNASNLEKRCGVWLADWLDDMDTVGDLVNLIEELQ